MIWSHLLKKSLMENFICTVQFVNWMFIRMANALCTLNYVLHPWDKFHAFHGILHCVKTARIRTFSGPYFRAFEQNTIFLFSPKNTEYRHFLHCVIWPLFLQTLILTCKMMKSCQTHLIVCLPFFIVINERFK